MSVRSRIKEFEALAQANDGSSEKRNEAKKRFHFPGNKRVSETEMEQPAINFTNAHTGSKIKTQRFDEFEADLQAAWSVRKNIHHQGVTSTQTPHSSSAPSMHSQAKAGQYSRHGAIPAQQTSGPKAVFGNKEKGQPFESRRSPLQEKNSKGATPWNVKTATYSYNSPEMATKRPIGLPPTNEITSPPTAKRRGNAAIFDMVRPTNEQKMATHFTTHTGEHHNKSEKVSYAKRMAQGYLKSMGMGEWTPKSSAPPDTAKSKQATTSPVHATKRAESGVTSKSINNGIDDDDDQDFDF